MVSLSPMLSNFEICDRNKNDLARKYAMSILESVEQNGVIFFYGEEELFTCAYLRIVEGVRPDVDLYDCKQNIFAYPISKKQHRSERITLAEASEFESRIVQETARPVYFTYKVRDDFSFMDYGVLYRIIRPTDNPAAIQDPWRHYESLRYLDENPFVYDGYTAIAVGKIHLARARRYWSLGDRERSDLYLNEALTDAALEPMVHKFAGYFFLETNRIDQAEQAMQRALELDPYISDSYNVLGVIAYIRGDLHKALFCYTRALELDTNSLMPLHNRGLVYEVLADREPDSSRSQEYYQAALKDLRKEQGMSGYSSELDLIIQRIARKLNVVN